MYNNMNYPATVPEVTKYYSTEMCVYFIIIIIY